MPGPLTPSAEPQRLPNSVLGTPAPMQLPNPATVPSPALPESIMVFDPVQTQIRRVNSRWQLWFGNVLLKDCGKNEGDAHEALRVLRELRINQRGTIGRHPTGFEYWLSEGEAPRPGGLRRLAVPFDGALLQVSELNGVWCLRDARQVIFNFGPHREDAELALQVCKKYRFNQIAYIGAPTPTMIYFLRDPFQEQESNAQSRIKLPPSSPTQLLAGRGADRQGVLVPGIGYRGERLLLDPRQLELRREARDWVIASGNIVLVRFGYNERDARSALQMLRDAQITEYCVLGPSFAYFLSNGQPIRPMPLGSRSLRIDNRRLQLREIDGNWTIFDGTRPLFEFGDRLDEAKAAFAIMLHYRFDQLSYLGNPLNGGLRVLTKGW